ncbi:hypothetical protein N7455_004539 [Penicillium solitum]|uniref:uncharacterized protein n=1 Tax=Penicillium solitum TaxID=60172 RepID=UPI001821B765|nr:hypothetical protein HAV15_003642 [Penicillium sp. str. \
MRKAAERVVAQLDGDEGGWRASNRPNETSLSVNMRKAAGRVVAALFSPSRQQSVWWLDWSGDGVGWWVSSPRIEPIERNVSVCDREEGSRACGGFIFWLPG